MMNFFFFFLSFPLQLSVTDMLLSNNILLISLSTEKTTLCVTSADHVLWWTRQEVVKKRWLSTELSQQEYVTDLEK